MQQQCYAKKKNHRSLLQPGPLAESAAFSCYLLVSLLRAGLKLLWVLQLLLQFLDLLLEEIPLMFSVYSLLLNAKIQMKERSTTNEDGDQY